jgi:hypothetical protein
MKVSFTALVCALTVACATDGYDNTPSPLLEGEWTLASIRSTDDEPARAVVSARLMLTNDNTWRLRYDFHLRGAPQDHLWSSGLAGTWQAHRGEPMAVRFEVTDDHSTSVGTLPRSGQLDVMLTGNQMRFVRTPD